MVELIQHLVLNFHSTSLVAVRCSFHHILVFAYLFFLACFVINQKSVINLCGGKSFKTRDPAAIMAPSPTEMLPRIVAPAPIRAPCPIFGCLSPCSFPVPPSVTPY